MSSFLKSENHSKRSISLPCRSHPSTDKLDVELNKIKSCNTSSLSAQNAKKIIHSLSGLMNLFKCLEDFLNLEMTKKALSNHQCEKYVYSLQDEFVTLLDICSTSRDFMSHIKENSRQIQTCLRTRRRNGDSTFENIVTRNTCFRRKIIKDAKKMVLETKQMESKTSVAPISEPDHHVSSVIRSIQEIVLVTSTILNSINVFVGVPVLKPKTRWSLVSKFLHNGALVACENQVEDLNELQNLDVALEQICKNDASELKDDQSIQKAQTSLKSLEMISGDIEDKLDCLFRGLIRARVNLLNISSTVE